MHLASTKAITKVNGRSCLNGNGFHLERFDRTVAPTINLKGFSVFVIKVLLENMLPICLELNAFRKC